MKVKHPFQKVETSPFLTPLAAALTFSVSLGWASQAFSEGRGFNDNYHNLPELGELSDGMYIAQAEIENEADPAVSEECLKWATAGPEEIGDIIRAGCQPTTAQMSALMDNPLGNVAMWINQFDLYRLENPVSNRERNKGNYMGILQFPKGISEDWNIINRIVYNVPSMPLDQGKIDAAGGGDYGSGPGDNPVLPPAGSPILPLDAFGGRTTGFGDMYYVGLFSPKKGIKHKNNATSVWGVGVDLSLPTASDDILGSGKWSAGPSALYAYMGPKWKLGALAQQYWSFAGDSDRDDVNLTNLQYFYYYSLDSTTSIGAMPNIIMNWEQSSGNKVTLPIGLGINKTVQLGTVPVRFGVELHYSVIQPDDVVGAKWDLRLYAIPAAPSALFKWMQ